MVMNIIIYNIKQGRFYEFSLDKVRFKIHNFEATFILRWTVNKEKMVRYRNFPIFFSREFQFWNARYNFCCLQNIPQ